MANGVWESDYVYDITMRVRRLLEQEHRSRGLLHHPLPGPGLQHPQPDPGPHRTRPRSSPRPPFANDGENPIAVSVHLRWVLANHLFAVFDRTGDLRKTLFISFHADSLHPSARGTMVYVPGAVGVPARVRPAAPPAPCG